MPRDAVPAVSGLDVAALRAAFPALGDGVAHFDGPGGSLTPRPVAEAVAAVLMSATANPGPTAAAERAEAIVTGARRAVADLLAAEAGGVVFGRSMTQLTYDLSRALAKQWGPGDEIVVTRLDHDANVRPWVQAAAAAGATVRWAPFDRRTGDLPACAVTELLGPGTRLVACTAASNLLGTRPDLPAIARAVHGVGALLYVDGVHLTPHAAVDVGALGADFYVCSPYKFFGPHCGVLAASPELLATIHPDKLLPATEAVPGRFEPGPTAFELLAGVTAAVRFIADLGGGDDGAGPGSGGGGARSGGAAVGGGGAGGGLRPRVLAGMVAIERHEEAVCRRLEARLDELPGVVRHGRAPSRTPTLLLTVEGCGPAEAATRLAAEGVNTQAGTFYAVEAARWMGLGDEGGLRVGLAPYTAHEDLDRLVDGLARIARA